jgi:hypothetical protein
MSSHHRLFASSLLLTGAVQGPDDPRIFASLFVDCLTNGTIPWKPLVDFHRGNRASPIDWPRSFAESRLMLTLAVSMSNRFGNHEACSDVTRTLAYHLIDREPHVELVAIVREFLH